MEEGVSNFVKWYENFITMINQINDLKIAVIGLGYVGLPLVLEFSKKKEYWF